MKMNGKWKVASALAIAISMGTMAGTAATANAATKPGASASSSAVRPMTPSECQGSPAAPNNATSGGVKYIELHTWTECFGTVDEVTSYLELQKWILLYPGTTDTQGEWEDVAGPASKNFPGATSTKLYQYASVKCGSVGGHGSYRTAAWATWVDSTGLTGTTTTGYSSSATLC